jgi:hypothetical protein
VTLATLRFRAYLAPAQAGRRHRPPAQGRGRGGDDAAQQPALAVPGPGEGA